jgi:hypothetical protein
LHVLGHQRGRGALHERELGQPRVVGALGLVELQVEVLVLERVVELVGERDLPEEPVGSLRTFHDAQASAAGVVVARHLLAVHRLRDLPQVDAGLEQAEQLEHLLVGVAAHRRI